MALQTLMFIIAFAACITILRACTENTPVCGKNEVVDDCPCDCLADYCPRRENDNKKCSKPDPCPPAACKCGFNFRRADNGTCIPTEECPPFDCPDCETWNPCPPICPTDHCGLPRIRGTCPFRIGIRLECSPKCQCQDGYGRTDDGVCVPFAKCPKLCPKNEEYNSCTQGLCRQQECSKINDPVACPKIDPAYCKKDCVCKENYYRNDNGTCVPADKCPASKCCGLNEEYKKSLIPKCPALGTCFSIVERIPCTEPESYGCVCKSGYLRKGGQNSPCVPICDCKEMASSPGCKGPRPCKY